MSNLLASFGVSGHTLDVFQQALTVVQNNVSNSSTPGYAKQQLNLEAMPFDITQGLVGGVAARGLQDSRDQYAEEAVQGQTQALGQYTAQAQGTNTIQGFFDVTGTDGVAAALSNLFQSFSAWSSSPGDPTARQDVLAKAGALAQSINGLANSLGQTAQNMDGQISSTVDQINGIAAQIRQYNVQKLKDTQPDPGQDARLYSALESLSQLTNFSTVRQSDGTVTVMLGGGTPLVIGDRQDSIQSKVEVDTPAANPQSPPAAHILDSQGNDITAEISSGQLGGLLDTRNRVLGSIIGDAQRQGTLNQLAQGLADTVNQILQSGTVSSDPGAAKGAALFTYSTADATAAAASLKLNPEITADQLAPVDTDGNANGNANQLAALANATGAIGTIAGLNFTEFFGQIATGVGQQNQAATANQQAQQQVVAQTKSLREQVSGVSLDEQAVNVLQFQRAYQATAQVLSVLNSIADATLAILPQY
jgi:flagellar hook-associated protein 1 FlgK